MAERTKTVITERKNEHKTRLVKSLQSISNLKDYTLMPEGVWGSKAIIRSGGVTIDSSVLDLEFDIPFDDNLEADEGEIIIYNLTDDTIRQLKIKAQITIIAGYEGDTGTIFDGYITKKTTERDGADKITTLKVIDDIKDKPNVNMSFSAGITANKILRTLLGLVKLPYGKISLPRDWTYENDVTVDEPLESAIKKYAEVCGASAFTSCGRLYCCPLEEVTRDGYFNVNESTGMIGSPLLFEETKKVEGYEDVIEGYEIDMLLQHRMSAGAKIQLKSEYCNGTFYVKSGEHIFNESECITKIKAIA